MKDIVKELRTVTSLNFPISTRALLDKAAVQLGTTRSALGGAIIREWLSERYEDKKIDAMSLVAAFEKGEKANV